MAAKKKSPLAFEAALTELEAIVGQLEQGELSLEQSLQCFEHGIALARGCQQILRDAEQKVEQLLETQPTQWMVTPFPAATDAGP